MWPKRKWVPPTPHPFRHRPSSSLPAKADKKINKERGSGREWAARVKAEQREKLDPTSRLCLDGWGRRGGGRRGRERRERRVTNILLSPLLAYCGGEWGRRAKWGRRGPLRSRSRQQEGPIPPIGTKKGKKNKKNKN